MESRAKLFGHSIHQQLIIVPLGSFVGAIIFDILYLIRGTSGWAQTAYYLIALGIISGLISAVFGLIDWTAIPWGTRAKRVGDQTLVITGASSGIGLVSARMAARRGARVVLAACNESASNNSASDGG